MNLSVQFGTPSLVVSVPREPYKVSAETPKVTAEFGIPEISIGFQESQLDVSTGTLIIRDNSEYPVYDGSYEVTPSQTTQTLETLQKVLVENIVINPIPSNYGKITWDGSVLTVS